MMTHHRSNLVTFRCIFCFTSMSNGVMDVYALFLGLTCTNLGKPEMCLLHFLFKLRLLAFSV